MSTAATVPVFSPDGKIWDIPYGNMRDAISKGGKLGVFIKDPQGKQWVIPSDKAADAAKAGGTIVPYDIQDKTAKEGLMHAFGSDLKGIGQGAITGMAAAFGNEGARQQVVDSVVQQISDAPQQDANRKTAGYGIPYRVAAPLGQAIGVNVPGMEQAAAAGDPGAVAGHAAAIPASMALTEGLARVAPLAREATGSIGSAARPAAASVLRAASDIIDPELTGVLSPRAAHAQRLAGRLAKAMEGKEGLEVYRDSTTENKVPFAGEEIPDQVVPRERDATRQNVEHAGEEIPDKSAQAAYRDATLNRRNVPEFAGEEIPDKPEPPATPQGQFTHQVDAKSLDALKSATSSIVDQVVPSSTNRGVNLWTKAQIELKLRSGDVAGAEKVLDQAGARSTPSYMAPERPEIVPATQNIRENDSLVAGAERSGRRSFQEAQDDAGVAQEMRADLDKHGYKAESEARREFIARNSHGTTKGEMAGAVKTTAIPAESLSLQEQLQLMLDATRRAQPKTK